jgi:hypothetical protein
VETLCLSLELPSPYFSFTTSERDDASESQTYVRFEFALLEAFRIAEEIRSRRAAGAPTSLSGGAAR